MIFDIRGAHPRFVEEIETTLRSLLNRFPFVPLRSVSLYEPPAGDTSMGATYPDGIIRLNLHWFAGDPDRLDDAAKRDHCVDADGVRIGWHGPMTREPEHVLHHEFWHVAFQAFPRDVISPWQRERWLAATKDAMRAPSGYALGCEPEEWAAEFGAMYSFGLATPEEAIDMEDLLRTVM